MAQRGRYRSRSPAARAERSRYLKDKNAANMHEETTELRMILKLRLPPRRSSAREPLIVKASELFWGSRKTAPKRAAGAFASHEVCHRIARAHRIRAQ